MYSKVISLENYIKMTVVSRKLKSGEAFYVLHKKHGKPFKVSYSDYKSAFKKANGFTKDSQLDSLRAGKTYKIPTYSKVAIVEKDISKTASANSRIIPDSKFKFEKTNIFGIDILDEENIGLGLKDWAFKKLYKIYNDAISTEVPEVEDIKKVEYTLPNATKLDDMYYEDKGKEVLMVQKIFSLLTAYGPRFKFDSYYGANMLGSILYVKNLMVEAYDIKPSAIGYGDTDTFDQMKKSAEFKNNDFAKYLAEILATRTLNKKPAFLLPNSSEVLQADLSNTALLEDIAKEEKVTFPVEYYNSILKHESGGSHFFKLNISELKTDLDSDGKLDTDMRFVIFGMDWRGWRGSKSNYKFSDRVTFYPKKLRNANKPPNQSEPWKNSTGWGLTQFTTFTHLWPSTKAAYIFSKKENLRAGLKLFIEKYKIAKRVLKRDADKKKNVQDLAAKNGLSTADDNINWLGAVWCYNGYSDAGFKYLTYIVEHYLKT
ncbi:hypothetical protein ACFL5G_02425 [Candidatus Margulisiibacteriota bacterium]